MEIRLNPIPADTLYSILKETKGADFNSTRARVASRLAQGSLARALGTLGDDIWSLRNQMIALLSSPAGEWLKLVEQIGKSQIQTNLGLDLLESIFSDLLQVRIRGDSHEWTHADQKDLLVQIADARGFDGARLCATLESFAEKRKLAGLTLNGKILAQEILIPVLEGL
jgi:hypothetical protein